jgi:hypothetical protein
MPVNQSQHPGRHSFEIPSRISAADLHRDPGLLVRAISCLRSGVPRTHMASPTLEMAVRTGEIAVQDVEAEISLQPPDDEASLLRAAASSSETEAHWHLKRVAWILAAAMMPASTLSPEALIDPIHRRKRADLIAIDPSERRSAVFEVGTVNQDSIIVALDAGHCQVMVLPHQHYGDDRRRGYVFHRCGASLLSMPSLESIRRAEAGIRRCIEFLAADEAASPGDLGFETWLEIDPPSEVPLMECA